MNSRGRTALVALAAALLLCLVSHASSIRLAWDPSPTLGVQYRLYAHTNTFAGLNLSNATVRLDAGTNRTATVSNIVAGSVWFFVVTAYDTNGLESVPSDELSAVIPQAPGRLSTVVLQWNATVSGTNWLDAGFFRVRFEP